jgi:hypothetical protein
MRAASRLSARLVEIRPAVHDESRSSFSPCLTCRAPSPPPLSRLRDPLAGEGSQAGRYSRVNLSALHRGPPIALRAPRIGLQANPTAAVRNGKRRWCISGFPPARE